MIEDRARSPTQPEFGEAVELQKRHLGLRRYRTAAACACSWSRPRSAARRSAPSTASAWSAFCLAIPGLKPGGKAYLHSHMLGVLPEYRDRGVGPPAEAAAAGGRAGARHRADRVDLRSARNQERLLQHGAAGRDRAPLRATISTAPPPAPCMAACPRTAASAEWWIASDARASRSWPAARRRRARRSRSASRCRPTSPSIRRDDPKRAREIQKEIGERFQELLRPRPGRDRLRAIAETAGAYLLGRWRMKIDKIVLRQIRMPLVHFFETSFGRTTERDIILVEVDGRRRFRLGRSHRRRESVLQRRVDRCRPG